MFKILKVANVGFSRYPYFIQNFYGELQYCTQLAVEKSNWESAFDCEILGIDSEQSKFIDIFHFKIGISALANSEILNIYLFSPTLLYSVQ